MSPEPSDPASPGWRVVERLGEARYLAQSMAGWNPVVPGSLIPAGSQITTGIGGRLIVQRADDQLSVATSSRFILPGLESDGNLRQTAGRLRYRIASAGAAEFGIETPFLDLMVGDAVLDVTVGESMTEVAVVSGRVRLRTQDGRRQIDLDAGHSGYASLEGARLAVRRGPDGLLERVPPTVIPALHPDRTADHSAERAADPEPESALDAVAHHPVPPGAIAAALPKFAPATVRPDLNAVGPPSVTTLSAPTVATPSEPSATTPAKERTAVPTSDRSPTDASVAPLGFVWPAAPSAPIDEARANRAPRPFDQLTEGLLDGLLRAQPAGGRPDSR